MAYEGYNLPAYNFFASFDEESLPEFEQCPLCSMWFLQMEEREDIERHTARCAEQAAEEARERLALGFKETSHGWFKGDDSGGIILP